MGGRLGECYVSNISLGLTLSVVTLTLNKTCLMCIRLGRALFLIEKGVALNVVLDGTGWCIRRDRATY